MATHESLHAYNAAVEVNRIVRQLVAKIKRHSQAHADHLQRTAASLEDNTAEGATATTPGRKANSYRIARDSGGECHAQIRRALRNDWITQAEWTTAELALKKAVFLMGRLVLKWEREVAANARRKTTD